VRNTIDFRRAQLVLRALHIAVKNSPRVHFDIYKSDMIHEVPNYPAPTVQKPVSAALAQAGALARIPRPKPVRIASPRPPIVAVSPQSARPKPPARVKAAPPAPSVARRRSG
jgi:hypothetical protein